MNAIVDKVQTSSEERTGESTKHTSVMTPSCCVYAAKEPKPIVHEYEPSWRDIPLPLGAMFRRERESQSLLL